MAVGMIPVIFVDLCRQHTIIPKSLRRLEEELAIVWVVFGMSYFREPGRSEASVERLAEFSSLVWFIVWTWLPFALVSRWKAAVLRLIPIRNWLG
jgi:hypothetical protein